MTEDLWLEPWLVGLKMQLTNARVFMTFYSRGEILILVIRFFINPWYINQVWFKEFSLTVYLVFFSLSLLSFIIHWEPSLVFFDLEQVSMRSKVVYQCCSMLNRLQYYSCINWSVLCTTSWNTLLL